MNIFKEARERKGITQRELSQKMNYSTAQFISNWERGVSHPPIKDLKMVCSEIDLDLNEATKFILEKKFNHVKKMFKKNLDIIKNSSSKTSY